MSPLKLPLGIDFFEKIIKQNRTYIDKTLFIKAVLDHGAESLLITRPRRFGKTLNLSMLRCFFSCHLNTPARDLFKNLAIMTAGDAYLEHMGRYPTLFLSLKGVRGEDYEQALESLREVIFHSLSEHDYLLSSPKLQDYEKERLNELTQPTYPTSRITQSLLLLSGALKKHWGEDVIILIDEYDAPIQHAYLHDYYEPMTLLIKDLLSNSLKTNPNLLFSIMTGILQVAKGSLFSGANQVVSSGVLQDDFESFFGFTQDEVNDLVATSGLVIDAQTIKQWYNGYRVGDTTLYNPWSILNLIQQRGKLMPYWVHSADNQLVQKWLAQASPSIKQSFEKLLAGQEIDVRCEHYLSFPDMNAQASHLWHLFIYTGYLTLAKTQDVNSSHPRVQIPNLEVQSLFDTQIKQWFTSRKTGHGLDSFIEGLLSLDATRVEEHLSDLFLESFSYYDTCEPTPERFYHAFILGLVVTLRDRYRVLSNRESGLGRFDIMLAPNQPNLPGILIEFKCANSNQNLNDVANEALKQIQSKRYATELSAKQINHIHAWGMAFQGKALKVTCLNLPH